MCVLQMSISAKELEIKSVPWFLVIFLLTGCNKIVTIKNPFITTKLILLLRLQKRVSQRKCCLDLMICNLYGWWLAKQAKTLVQLNRFLIYFMVYMDLYATLSPRLFKNVENVLNVKTKSVFQYGHPESNYLRCMYQCVVCTEPTTTKKSH